MSAPALHHPPELHYLIEHQVWARLEGDGSATVGITQLGVALSGEIYMCRPKRLGTQIAQGAGVAVVELAKAIVSVKTPVAGTLVELNPRLEQRPGLVHADPYGAGWIARLQLAHWDADRAQLVHGEAVAAAMAAYAQAMGLEQIAHGPATGRV